MAETAYTTRGLPPPPNVSMTTVPMAGLLVDVYGLDELGPASSAPLTCLWLFHPRTHTRARMNDFARRAVQAWNDDDTHNRSSSSSPSSGRGLVALAFDMPNHGSRMVSSLANKEWAEGNERHALDMAAMVKGGVSDMSGLMDVVAGYLQRRVDAHVCLGWSLGGHAAWQAYFNEGRIDAAVAIVGCPDYMGLLSTRAKSSNLTLNTEDSTEDSFLGSPYFPLDLVDTCLVHDPKGILFGTGAVPAPPLHAEEQVRLRALLDARIQGKKMLACSGGRDKLVQYANSEPMLNILKDALGEGGWYADGNASVDARVYDDVGHSFNAPMVMDAIAFLVERVGNGPRRQRARM